MVRALGQYQARGASTRRSWYDWLDNPETVSGLTVLAALHLIGPDAAAEVLFGSGSDTTTEDAVLDDLRARLAEVEGELTRQQTESSELRRQVQDLISRRGEGTAGGDPSPQADHGR
jgi:hypothetical protein